MTDQHHFIIYYYTVIRQVQYTDQQGVRLALQWPLNKPDVGYTETSKMRRMLQL